MTPLPLSVLVPLALVAGLSAPSLALLLALAAPNKVAGFAVVKVLNLINLLPLIAYFVPAPVNLIAGILPAFWPMRALWAAAAGESMLPFLSIGTVVVRPGIDDRGARVRTPSGPAILTRSNQSKGNCRHDRRPDRSKEQSRLA